MRRLSRRALLRDAGWAGAASLGLALLTGCEAVSSGRLFPARTSEDGRLETTTIRLVQIPTICQAPQYLITELMRGEGFTQVEYVKKGGTKEIETALAAGEADINPWSQYFCCMITGNTTFVQKHPVATKHAMRAILKSADLCSQDPSRAARTLVDGGYTPNYEYALEALTGIPYGKWREFDAEDTVRFYSLRLQEAGMSKSTPDQIMRRGTNWRFFNELRQELKA
jgi:hypothetical protein